ncbi:MAG TPA: hypothetical protein VI757_00440 [Bacteroidia bacterium]|nr:hypothetical protein [Bacteroidia bacterium]
MSKGIVRVTPKPGASGSLQVTVADSNPYRVTAGSILSFADPGFPVIVGESVDCTITSGTTCDVIRVPVPAGKDD